MDIQKIKQMTEDGFAIRRIANILKLEKSEIKNLIITNNWSTTKEEFSNDKINHIINLYEQGVSAKALGIKYSISKLRVQKWVKEKGLLRNKNDSHRVTPFNQHIFDVIDTEEKAYWLGFFYADAYNCKITNTVNLALQIRDLRHVQKLATFMGLSIDKICCSSAGPHENGKSYEHASLKMYSKHLCEMLTLRGCPQAKSFIIKYPEWLNTSLNKHFIRGMFEGDGCITYRKNNKEWKWGLVSTKECCESIQNIISQNINIKINYEYISKTSHNTYNLSQGGNEKILQIMHWLYSDATIYLDRKYQKYLDLIEHQNNRAFLKNTGRSTYLLSQKTKDNIMKDINNGKDLNEIATNYNIHLSTVERTQINSNKIKLNNIKKEQNAKEII